MDTIFENTHKKGFFDIVDSTYIDGSLHLESKIVIKKDLEDNDFRQIYHTQEGDKWVDGYIYSFGKSRVFVDRSIENLSCWSELLYSQ